MHPDLKHIYNELKEYTSQEQLMGHDVDLRVEDNIVIKVYIRDENGINGQMKKPLMIVYFSRPGILTVKFLMLDPSKSGYLFENFRLLQLESNSFKVDFEKLEDFEHFVGAL